MFHIRMMFTFSVAAILFSFVPAPASADDLCEPCWARCCSSCASQGENMTYCFDCPAQDDGPPSPAPEDEPTGDPEPLTFMGFESFGLFEVTETSAHCSAPQSTDLPKPNTVSKTNETPEEILEDQ